MQKVEKSSQSKNENKIIADMVIMDYFRDGIRFRTERFENFETAQLARAKYLLAYPEHQQKARLINLVISKYQNHDIANEALAKQEQSGNYTIDQLVAIIFTHQERIKELQTAMSFNQITDKTT